MSDLTEHGDSERKELPTIPKVQVDTLREFYSFIAEIDEAWASGLNDFKAKIPNDVSELLEVVTPPEPLFGRTALKILLWYPNVLLKLAEKPPIAPDRVRIQVPQEKFCPGFAEDFEIPTEFARTVRILNVLSNHSKRNLAAFKDMLALELAALEGTLFTHEHMKRLFVGCAIGGAAVAVGWSAFSSHFLGLDFIQNTWTEFANSLKSGMGFWGRIFAWLAFFIGLIFIWFWTLRLYLNRRQRYRLSRVRRWLILYLMSDQISVPHR